MSSVLTLEPMTDECTDIFVKKMYEKAGEKIDLGEWLQWYVIKVKFEVRDTLPTNPKVYNRRYSSDIIQSSIGLPRAGKRCQEHDIRH